MYFIGEKKGTWLDLHPATPSQRLTISVLSDCLKLEFLTRIFLLRFFAPKISKQNKYNRIRVRISEVFTSLSGQFKVKVIYFCKLCLNQIFPGPQQYLRQLSSRNMSSSGLFRLGGALRRASSSSSEEELPPPSSNRVKRALFGPTDHDENIRFVENELKKARNEASSRWNFDFDSGKPLQGNYDWEEISCTTAETSIMNPDKHSSLTSDDVKENTGDNTASPLTAVVSEEVAARLQVPESLLSSSSSEKDLKTPPGSSSEPASSSLQLGAKPKTKEIKMTGNWTLLN